MFRKIVDVFVFKRKVLCKDKDYCKNCVKMQKCLYKYNILKRTVVKNQNLQHAENYIDVSSIQYFCA